MLFREDAGQRLTVLSYQPQRSPSSARELSMSIRPRTPVSALRLPRSVDSIGALQIHSRMAGEFDHRPVGAKHIRLLRSHGSSRHASLQNRRHHLRGHEAVPDQFVQLIEILLEILPDRLGIAAGRGRPNGFMRLPAPPFAFYRRWASRADNPRRIAPESTPSHLRPPLGNARRVRPHIGDQPVRTLFADLDPFIQLLRERHRLFRGKLQFPCSFLLKPLVIRAPRDSASSLCVRSTERRKTWP